MVQARRASAMSWALPSRGNCLCIVSTVGYAQVVFDEKIVDKILGYFPDASKKFAVDSTPKGPTSGSASSAAPAPRYQPGAQSVPDEEEVEGMEEQERKEARERVGDKVDFIELADRILAVMLIHATKEAFHEVLLNGSVIDTQTSEASTEAKRTLVLDGICLAVLIREMLDKKGPAVKGNTSRVLVLQLDEYPSTTAPCRLHAGVPFASSTLRTEISSAARIKRHALRSSLCALASLLMRPFAA